MICDIIIQGTTPEHEFTLPFDTSLIKGIRISYAQKGKEIFSKVDKDCVYTGNVVKIVLTQEDTFLFDEHNLVEVQIKILTMDNSIHTNDDDIRLRVKKGFNREVLK